MGSTEDSSPFTLPKPCLNVFNSAGKLAKKHDSVHDRLSLPILAQTPGTPKTSRSKFVLPSSLSPFPFSPKNAMRNPSHSKLYSSLHASSTPLRQGYSSEQLVFDSDLCGKLTHSPSRLTLDRAASPMSSQLRDCDMFELTSEFGSELDNLSNDVDMNCAEYGSCDISPEMLRPLIWRNPAVHFLSTSYLNDLYSTSEDMHPHIAIDPSLLPDYFDMNFDILESYEDGAFSVVHKVKDRHSRALSAVKRSRAPFTGYSDRCILHCSRELIRA